jgi:hypothetical protein
MENAGIRTYNHLYVRERDVNGKWYKMVSVPTPSNMYLTVTTADSGVALEPKVKYLTVYSALHVKEIRMEPDYPNTVSDAVIIAEQSPYVNLRFIR